MKRQVLSAVPVLPTGVYHTFFSAVIFFFLLEVRMTLDGVRLSTLTHTHTHAVKRLLQVINYVCKGGNKELCQWLLLPSVSVCRSGRKINTRLWNWFCRLCGGCEPELLVCVFILSLCWFALLSTSSPNLFQLLLTSAGFTPHRRLLYLWLMCI